MTIITANIILDSIWEGKRITTIECTYPRFIHAEVLTHRAFSRNSSSSRAIPIQRVIDDVRQNMVIPLHWGKNQAGMQADTQVDSCMWSNCREEWIESAERAIGHAQHLADLGLHKQVVNRILEPYQHIRTLITATEWKNFFTLRNHPDAEPHIRMLAVAIRRAMFESETKEIGAHIPFTDGTESDPIAVSIARCARVSYKTFDGKPSTLEADIALGKKLLSAEPRHASPAEHQAVAKEGWHANFNGWQSYRNSQGW